MSGRFEILVRDRATGRLDRERVFAEAFLFWLYNTGAGRLAGALVFRRRWASRLYGWLQRQPVSRRRVAGLIEAMGIDMSESLRRPEEFGSFAEFFVREIDLSKRPVDSGPTSAGSAATPMATASISNGASATRGWRAAMPEGRWW